MDPILKVNIDSFSTREAVEGSSADYLRTSELSAIAMVGEGSRVLDLGCGTGRTTAPIAQRGAEVVGGDISEAMIAKARELHPGIDFRVMDALSLPFPDRHFDAVFFFFNGLDNLHPAAERRKALREIRRTLKPGGLLAYSFHNALAVPRTKEGLKAFLGNLPHLRLGPHYRTQVLPFGTFIQYYNTPRLEKKLVESEGFAVKDVISNGRVVSLPVFLQTFAERFPLIVANTV